MQLENDFTFFLAVLFGASFALVLLNNMAR
jgi:hypothetical protein